MCSEEELWKRRKKTLGDEREGILLMPYVVALIIGSMYMRYTSDQCICDAVRRQEGIICPSGLLIHVCVVFGYDRPERQRNPVTRQTEPVKPTKPKPASQANLPRTNSPGPVLHGGKNPPQVTDNSDPGTSSRNTLT